MKRSVFACLLSIFLIKASGSIRPQHGYKQTLMITNIGNKSGTLYIGWYNKAENFRKADGFVLQRKVDVGGRTSVAVAFDSVAAGTYAVAVFLDENANGRIDTNFFGIPKEKYGFSNNVFPMMRAASFKESAFEVKDKDETIMIRLK